MSSPSSPEREPAELLQQLQHAFASLYAAQTPADVLDALARLLPPGFASAELLLADRAAPDTLALAATWTPAGAQLAREARALRDYPPSSAGVLAIADVAADPSLSETARAWLIRKGIGALVLMPMSTGQAPAGLVMFTAPVPVDVSAERVQVLRVLSDLAAMALQSQRVLQSTAERDSGQVDLPRLLNQISTRLAQFTEQAALLDYVTEELSRLADIDHVGIVLLEPDGVYGRVISEYPPSAALGSLLNMQENPLLTMALRDPDHPLIVEDAQHSALLPAETKALFTTMGVQDLMIVPLVVAGELIGSMGLDIYSPDKHFSEDAVEIGRLIGTQMVTSLQNIRLLSSERQRAEELAQIARNEMLLSQIGARYQQVQSVDDLLQVTLEELGAALGAERASIRMSAGDAPLLEAGR
jgi:GAF domain-containing protein